MPGTSLALATLLALQLSAQAVDQSALAPNSSHFYKVPISTNGAIELSLTGITQDAKVQVLDSTGSAILAESDRPGLLSETLSVKGLAPGDYHIRVTNKGSASTPYKLRAASPQSSSGIVWERNNTAAGGQFGDIVTWNSGSTNTAEGISAGKQVGFSPAFQSGDWAYQGIGNFGSLGRRYVVRAIVGSTVEIRLVDPISGASTALVTYAASDTYSKRWNVRGVADIDNNGRSEIFLSNDEVGGTGEVFMYAIAANGTIDMPNSKYVGSAVPLSLGYKLFGAGRDPVTGTPRLFWYKGDTGTFEVWNLNTSGTYVSSYTMYSAGQNWSALQMRSAGDFDSDGDADFLGKNTSTGDAVVIRTSPGATPALGEWIDIEEQQNAVLEGSAGTVSFDPTLLVPTGDYSGMAHSFAGDNPKNSAFDLGTLANGATLDLANMVRPAVANNPAAMQFRNYYKFTLAAQTTITLGSNDQRYLICTALENSGGCNQLASPPVGGFGNYTLNAGTYYLRVSHTTQLPAGSGITSNAPFLARATLSAGNAIAPVEVGNFDVGNKGSNVSQFVQMGSWHYFLVSDGAEDEPGLYRTNGTQSGTTLVKALSPGNGELVAIGSTLYFSASDDKGTELWKSDGTAAGTVRAADILTGEEGSNPSNLTEYNGILYFVAQNATDGYELWRFNGTAATGINIKTTAIPNTTPALNVGSNPSDLTVMGNVLYFSADSNANGRELHKVTTSNVVSLVQDLVSGAGSSNPSELTVVGGKLVFSVAQGGQDATTGQDQNIELATSDGTTIVVSDLWSGNDANGKPNSSNPGDFAGWGNDAYFSAFGADGREMGRINTANNAVTTWDLWTGSTSGVVNSSNPGGFTVLGSQLIFSAENSVGNELWSFSGSGSPALLKDINTVNGSSNPIGMKTIGAEAYFTASANGDNYELWKTNGTGAGTVLVSEINTGNGNIDPSLPYGFTNTSNGIIFNAFTNPIGVEPRVLNGSTVTLLKDINTVPNDGQEGKSDVLNGSRYYSVYTVDKGQELWRSNGSTSNMVCDLAPGVASSSPSSITKVGNFIFFAATAGDGTKLYKTDGTNCMVADNASGLSGIGEIVESNGNAIFYSRNANGLSLRSLSSTGTTSTEIKNFGQEGLIAEIKNVGNGDVWMSARDTSGADTGLEPYKLSGGVLAAMGNIGSGNNGADSSNPYEFLRVPNGDVYAAVNHPTNGYELYRWGGGTGTAQLVSNMGGGEDGSNLTGLVHLGNNRVGWWSYANGGWSPGCQLVEGALTGTCTAPPANTSTAEPTHLQFFVTNGTAVAKPLAGRAYSPSEDPAWTDEQKALAYNDYTSGLPLTSSLGATYHYPASYADQEPDLNLAAIGCPDTGISLLGRSVATVFGTAPSSEFTVDDEAYFNQFGYLPFNEGNRYRQVDSSATLASDYISSTSSVRCKESHRFNFDPARYLVTSHSFTQPDPRLVGSEDITLGKIEHNGSARLYMANYDVESGRYAVWSISHAEILTKRLDANGAPGQKQLRFEGSFAWERGSLVFQPNGASMQVSGYDPVAKRQKVVTIGGL